MEAYARGRYSRVGENDAWVPGVKGTQCTKCGDCLPRCPERLQIPELLWDAHQRLETGEVKPPMWQHEGDLVERSLEQGGRRSVPARPAFASGRWRVIVLDGVREVVPIC